MTDVGEDGLAVKAHTYALSAEEAFAACRYEEASSRHASAASCFAKLFKLIDGTVDPGTSHAISILANYHKSKSKEMKRRARSSDARSNASSSASSQRGVPSPTPAQVPTTPASPAPTPPSLKTIPAFNLVQQRYEEIKQLLPGSPLDDRHALIEESGSSSRKPSLRQDETTTGTGAEQQLSKVLGDSFFFVPRTKSSNSSAGEEDGRTEVQHVVRHLQARIRVLVKENANLSRDLAALQRTLQERNSQQLQIESFKEEYRKRFEVLKLAMQHFQEAYAQGDNDGRRTLLEKRLAESVLHTKQLAKKLEREREKRKAAEARVAHLEQQRVN